jgi:multidrug efflux pump subunit AcrA (membrane-fusion protein)
MHNDKVLAETTTQLAAPTVIALPCRSKVGPTDTFVLPGNVTAYTDSPIYARTAGYLTRWYFDIGARVKKGQLLCEIASPEVDQQLAQAEADLTTAKATANNAHIQADRYTGLVESNSVSRQDTDTFVNQAAATASSVRFRASELAAAARTAIVRKGVCAIRWRGDRTRRGYGPVDRPGREPRSCFTCRRFKCCGCIPTCRRFMQGMRRAG